MICQEIEEQEVKKTNKFCSKCKELKSFDCFSKDSSKKDGLKCVCKGCVSAHRKVYYKNNKDYILKKNKEWAELNPEKVKIIKNKYVKSDSYKIWKENNKDKINENKKRWYKENPEKVKLIRQRWRTSKTCKNYMKKYKKKRLNQDHLYKLRENISSLIRNSISYRGYRKNGTKVEKILGCSVDEFKLHIEKQFEKNMNWDNYGEWEFDHVIPNSFGKNYEDIINLNHFSNFQPLWRLDNILKSNKILK